MITDLGKYYLYRHIRLDNNQVFYIGIGTKIKQYTCYKAEYYRAHRTDERSEFWKRIVDKYGYKIEILLESNDYEFIKRKEKEFITLYGRKDLKLGNLCNMTDGGDGTVNLKRTQEWKDNISKGNKGKKLSKEAKEKISIFNKGKIIPIEIRKKISDSTKGKKLSEETKRKMSESQKKVIRLKGNNSKPILQYDLEGNFIREWESAREANKIEGFNYRNISLVLKNIRKKAGGFIWKFKN